MGVVAFQQYEQTYYHWTAYLKMAKKGNFMLRVPYRNQKKKKKNGKNYRTVQCREWTLMQTMDFS